MSSALSRHAHSQYESTIEGGEGFYYSMWSCFNTISEYSNAFTESIKRPDIILKILDPIVENNRRIFWFLFQEEEEENVVSLYDFNSVKLSVPTDQQKFLIETESVERGICNIIEHNLLPPLTQSTILLEETIHPLLGTLEDNTNSNGAWWMPFMAVLIITLFPSFLIYSAVSLKRIISGKANHSQIEIPKLVTLLMLAFASGGLLGDVVLHIFPLIFSSPSQPSGDIHSTSDFHCLKSSLPSIAFLCGIFLFWIFELVFGCNNSITAMPHSHSAGKNVSDRSIDHDIKILSPDSASIVNTEVNFEKFGKEPDASMTPRRTTGRSRSLLRKRHMPSSANVDSLNLDTVGSNAGCGMSTSKYEEDINRSKKTPSSDISNLVNNFIAPDENAGLFGRIKLLSGFAAVHLSADLLHNFTDGLALAAAWSSNTGGSKDLGISTTLAILLHEIPHELGDIAALVHMANWTFISALKMQMVTSTIGSIGGLVVGLLLSNLSGSSTNGIGNQSEILTLVQSTILPFSAGGFIYMSLAMLLPQLKTESVGLDIKNVSLIVLSAVAGVALLAFI